MRIRDAPTNAPSKHTIHCGNAPVIGAVNLPGQFETLTAPDDSGAVFSRADDAHTMR